LSEIQAEEIFAAVADQADGRIEVNVAPEFVDRYRPAEAATTFVPSDDPLKIVRTAKELKIGIDEICVEV
jgi:uncharacterized protein related to proFAR isomerase